MFEYYVIASIAVVLTSFCQLMLKLGVMHGSKSMTTLRIYLNFYTLGAYSLLFVATLLSVYAFKYLPLKVSVVLQPVNYLLVALLSFWVLNETLSKRQTMGIGIILLGMVLFYF